MRRVTFLLVLFGLLACGGADRATRKLMLEWAEVIQVATATSEYANVPDRLGDIEPELRALMGSRTDAWGTDLLYRKIRPDYYHLISAGPNGEFGDEDDIVCVTGHFRDTMQSYAEFPLKPGDLS